MEQYRASLLLASAQGVLAEAVVVGRAQEKRRHGWGCRPRPEYLSSQMGSRNLVAGAGFAAVCTHRHRAKVGLDSCCLLLATLVAAVAAVAESHRECCRRRE